jgi:asparagine synthetase B (glutamine-hydrolysing)
MCGIFAYLLKGKSKASRQAFSWRHLWNNLYTIKARGPDNMQLLKVSD